jgi:(p)ppGpp synthase/HD superfamily hydrolase
MSQDKWVEKYQERRPKYEKLTRKVRDLLEEILEREGVKATFESRAKKMDRSLLT